MNKENQREFKDVKESDWYSDAVGSASEEGLITGYTDGTFKPKSILNCEEMFAMAVRALKMVNGDQTSHLNLLSPFSDN